MQPDNTKSDVRFLPQLEGDNPFVEFKLGHMPFHAGIAGGNGAPVTITYPSPLNHGINDPAVDGTRHLWSGSDQNRQQAKLWYFSSTYLANVLILSSPIKAENERPPANPIRIADIARSLYREDIEPVLMDLDMEFSFADPIEGRDGVIRKTKSGAYASYTVRFQTKPRPLTAEELAAVETHGLHDLLAEFGPRPTDEQIAVLAEMFHASLHGEPFDAARWGAAYPGLKVQEVRGSLVPLPPSNGNGRASRYDADDKPAAEDGLTKQTLSALRSRVTTMSA